MLPRSVAIKCLHHQNNRLAINLLMESAITSYLSHPQVVPGLIKSRSGLPFSIALKQKNCCAPLVNTGRITPSQRSATVSTSWPMFINHCKSRVSALARECFLSRVHWKAKYVQKIGELHHQVKALVKRCQQAEAARNISKSFRKTHSGDAPNLSSNLKRRKSRVFTGRSPRSRTAVRSQDGRSKCQSRSSDWPSQIHRSDGNLL